MTTNSPLPTPTHCACGQRPDEPELNVTDVPAIIRHRTVHALFEATAPGASMILVAPHDPQPVLRELRAIGDFDLAYLQEGPEAWKLRITRT